VIFAAELNRPDGALDGVGIGFDAAVLEKQTEPQPGQPGEPGRRRVGRCGVGG
jgi:hypothetical protein